MTLATALATGCGSDDDGATTGRAGNTAGNTAGTAATTGAPAAKADGPCPMLTQAEVEQALQIKVTDVRVSSSTCLFGITPSISFSVDVKGKGIDYESERGGLETEVDVPNLGKGAYFDTTHTLSILGILLGESELRLELLNTTSAQSPVSGDVKAALISLANLALPRI